jgi:hypothetical protein
MSYDRFHRHSSPAAIQSDLTSAATRAEDTERSQFILHLDAAPVDVTDWEADFIESFLRVPEAARAGWWTEHRRSACDSMRNRYSGQL